MVDPLAKLYREMRRHPELFDFADLPDAKPLTPAQQEQSERTRPEWLKALLGKATGA